MAKRFFKKSVAIADFIAFILPISQLNNTRSLYEFDLIHSEDLGIQHYTDRDLHCCFNIYQRPKSGILNKREKLQLEDVSIYSEKAKNYKDKAYDIRMCYWGNGSAGKILKEDEHYAGEYKIKINNPDKKDAIINFLNNFDWRENMNCIAMRKIEIHHIITLLKENIEGIK